MNEMRSAIALRGCVSALHGQSPLPFSAKVEQVMSRPEYRHSRFGIEVYSLDGKRPLYELNAGQLFIPGSTTKLWTMGTALGVLGLNFRFHTRVYRSGDDLVLVAGGDPNLSNRIQPDGTPAFQNVDHSYNSTPGEKVVPGDPLAVIRDLARQVAARGIRKIDGRVLVDVSLFPEGERELGTGVVISPMVVNDNVIDLTVSPAGIDSTLATSPVTGYVKFINRIQTGAARARCFPCALEA